MDEKRVGHPIEQFRARLAGVPDELFPACLTRIDQRELEKAAGGPVGVAAYPLSHGLYAAPGHDHARLPAFPEPGRGLMVVGNHPDSRRNALARLRERGPHGDPSPTGDPTVYWRRLYSLLDDAGIDRHLLFATNIHPAFHVKAEGAVPKRGNAGWFEQVRALLVDQMVKMRPRLVLAFGHASRRELIKLALGVEALPLNQSVPVAAGEHTTRVLYAHHPSARLRRDQIDERTGAVRRAWATD